MRKYLAKNTVLFNAPFGGWELMPNQKYPQKQSLGEGFRIVALHKVVRRAEF